MKKHLSVLMLIAALLLPWASKAQTLGEYTFSTGTDATLWYDMTGSTQILSPSGSDGLASAVQNIGFVFPFGEDNYTQFSVNTDGNLRLGSTATGTANYTTPFSSSNANINNPKINGFGCDGYGLSGSHYVKKLLVDDSILVVEFCTGTFNSTTRNNLYKWQVHLYASGNVEIVYPSASDIPTTAPAVVRQCGLCINAADGWTISASHVATHFTAGTSTTVASGTWPDANRYYRFARPYISCAAPRNLWASATQTDATLRWTPQGSESEWEVTFGGSTYTVNDTFTTVTGLTPNTSYTFSVRAICGAGDTSSVRTASFHTPCVYIDTLPYVYGFEGVATTTNTTVPTTWAPCWTLLNNASQYFGYPYISSTASYCHGGSRGLYWYACTTTGTYGDYQCIVLPGIDPDVANVSELTLKFWAKATSASYHPVFKVGVMTDPADINTFTEVTTVEVEGTTWVEYEAYLSIYQGTGCYVAIKADRPVSSWYANVDDITLDYMPSCPAPMNLHVMATSSSATLTWTPAGTETEWEVNIDNTTTIVYDTTATVTGLTPNTNYTISVRAICGTDDSSDVSTTQFRTPCVAIDANALPYTENFENDGTGTTAFPSCWYKLGSTADRPYIHATTTYGHGDNSHGLYFYATATGYCYGIMPHVDSLLDLNTLQVSFWARQYSTSYNCDFVVGVMTDPTDTSTFIPLDVVHPAGTEYEQFDVPLTAYTGTGVYVAFRAVQHPGTSTAIYLMLDDVTLEELPSCVRPTGLTATNVSTDEITITWQPGGYESEWVISDGTNEYSAYDTTYTISNLSANTSYEISVRAMCGGGDTSDATLLDVRTSCGYISAAALPYTEDFESYGSGTTVFPACWYKIGSTADRPYIHATTTYGHNNSHGLYFYATAGGYCYAIMPPVDSALDLSTMQVTFWARQYSTSYNSDFVVGVMTDPTDTSTFTAIDQVHPLGTEYEMFEVPLSAYTGTGLHVAFQSVQHPGTTTAIYLLLDDVTLAPQPDCPRPIALNADSISYDAALLTWVSGNENATSYNVYYSTQAGFNPDTCQFTTVYDTAALITGLQSYTKYYWTVVANCGSDTSNVPALQSFTTKINCGPNSVNILDTIGEGTSSGYTYFAYNYSSYPYGKSASIFTADELGAMGLLAGANINSISVHAGATSCTINGFKVYMAETNFDEFSAVSDTNLINALNPTLVFNGTFTTQSSQWVEIPFTTPFAYSGNNNLIIIFERNVAPSASGTIYYGSTSPEYRTLYVYKSSATATASGSRVTYRVNVAFNLCAEVPACARPTDVSLSDLTDNSAKLSWVSNVGNYEYTIGPSGFNPDSSTAVVTPVTVDSVVITGLTSNTEYDFYVRTVCSNGISDWSIVTTFRTACSPMQLPYTEDFEAYASGSANPISVCWNKGTNNTTAYPYPFATNAITGQRSLYFYASHPSSGTAYYSYAALPMMAAPVDTLAVAFSMRRYSTTTATYTSRLVVGVMVNPEDISTFTPVDTFDLRDEEALSVHRFEVLFNNYTGNGQYIAFYDEVPPLYGNTNSYSYLYLDDIEVDYIPTCSRPTNVTINNIGQTTATVHWTSSATNFEVEYGEHGFVQGTGTTLTASVDSVDITGLVAGINYDVYVRALCSATDMSPWSFAANFYTECGIFALPYTEDFESYNSGASIGISPCWVKGTNYTTQYPYPYSTNAVTGQRSLYFYASHPSSGTAYYSYAALPEFNAPVNTLELSFNMRRYNSTSNTYTSLIVVGVMTDPTNINTFSAIDTIDLQTATASSIHEVNVTFDSYTDTGKYITLYAPVPPLYGTGTYCYNYTYIDDIFVAPISPCPRAYDLTAYNGTTTSVTLEWTDTIGSSQWVLEYGVLGNAATTTVTVSTNPYVLTGLTPNTNYRYRVAPICSTGQQADWSRTWHKFSTAFNPATMPYSYDFEAAGEWANWQTNSNNAVNWYRGNVAQGNTTNALYLSTDNGATHSWNMNSITNAVVYRDIDFGSDTHSFQVDFDAYIGGTIGHNYDGISVVVADPAVFVEGSNTGITSPWGHVNDVALGTIRHDTLWGHHTIYIDAISGVKRLAFYHFNQATGSGNAYEDNPPAIDNVSIVQQACVRPSDLVATNATLNSVDLSWTGDATAQYEISYRVQGAAASTNVYVTTTGTSYTLTGLPAATSYYWWVRKICSMTATDTVASGFSANSVFTTQCGVVSVADTLFENFENITGVAYNTVGELPNCWEGYNATNTLTAHVTNGSTYSYCVSGTQAVTMTSGTNASYTGGTDNYMRLVDIAEPTNTLTMTFWMCTESSTNGFLEIGYLTGSNYETDFVAVKRINASTATVHSGNGLQPAGHGIFDTVTFDSVPMGNFPICFRWNYTTSYYSCCIDDVKVWSNNACIAPVVTVSAVTYEAATITAQGNGVNFMLNYGDNPVNLSNNLASTTGVFNLTGLTPNTQYFYSVSQQCDSVTVSFVTEGTFTTVDLPCFAVSNLEVTNTGYTDASFSWTAGGDETAWEVKVYSTVDSVLATVQTDSATVDGLVPQRAYNVIVRPLCGSNANIEGPWSDTVQFSTNACLPVSDVVVSDITATSASVAWTASGDATNFRVAYGFHNFSQGEELGIFNTATNPYALTDLEPATEYTVQVATVCTESLVSAYVSADFTTANEEQGIDGTVLDNAISLYPNPASTMVTLRVGEQMVGSTVSIVDVNGREAMSETLASETLTIDLSQLAKGAYFVRVTGEQATVVRKLIVK